MLSHKCSLTREECSERINAIQEIVKQNSEIVRANNSSIAELTVHVIKPLTISIATWRMIFLKFSKTSS